MSRVDDLTEYQRYRVEYLGNLVFDDLVWHQSIVSLERLQTFCGGLRADPDDSVFWNLLMRGVLDMAPEERPNDVSARAVRYSAVMGSLMGDGPRGASSGMWATSSCLILPNLLS